MRSQTDDLKERIAYKTRQATKRPPNKTGQYGQMNEVLSHVVVLLTAVSICMAFVVADVTLGPPMKSGMYLLFTESWVISTEHMTNSIRNAFVFVGTIMVTTCIMLTIFYYRFYGVLRAWVATAVSVLLLLSSVKVLAFLLTTLNLATDIVTTALFLWNIEVIGLASVFSKGPLIVQQGFLILISAGVSTLFARLIPDRTMWWILSLLPFWDLYAVLWVHGPLRILVEVAEERRENFQEGVIFSTSAACSSARKWAHNVSRQEPEKGPEVKNTQRSLQEDLSTTSAVLKKNVLQPTSENLTQNEYFSASPMPRGIRQRRPEKKAPAPQCEDGPSQGLPETSADFASAHKRQGEKEPAQDLVEEPGLQMGLGDFIFYSTLVAKAALFGNWSLTIACALSILVGICLTLAMMVVVKKAVPALPVSLLLGLTCVALNSAAQPFTRTLQERQIYV